MKSMKHHQFSPLKQILIIETNLVQVVIAHRRLWCKSAIGFHHFQDIFAIRMGLCCVFATGHRHRQTHTYKHISTSHAECSHLVLQSSHRQRYIKYTRGGDCNTSNFVLLGIQMHPKQLLLVRCDASVCHVIAVKTGFISSQPCAPFGTCVYHDSQSDNLQILLRSLFIVVVVIVVRRRRHCNRPSMRSALRTHAYETDKTPHKMNELNQLIGRVFCFRN